MATERLLLTTEQIDDLVRQARQRLEEIRGHQVASLPTCPACGAPTQQLVMSEYEDGSAHIDFEGCGHLFRVEGDPPLKKSESSISRQTWIDCIGGDG